MRCPECGFHSFDYLDHCKKCGVDLTKFKQRLRLQGEAPTALPVVGTCAVPAQATVTLPAEFDEPEEEDDAIDFGFDILEEASARQPRPFGGVPAEEHDRRAVPDPAAPAAALAETDGLDFDNPFPDSDGATASQSFPGATELDLEQPFPLESEPLPDGDLPKFDDRF